MLRARLVLVAALLSGSCLGGPSAGLLEVRELSPRHAEVGEHLQVTGSGFPDGPRPSVLFQGHLYRAGEPVERDVEVMTAAELVSPHSLDLAIGPALVDRLCGGADPRRTTFRGDLVVRFAPSVSGGAPVAGRLEGVTLDITPDKASDRVSTDLRAEGLRFARFIGLSVTSTEGGLSVTQVEPRSRAARAGLLPGDVVLELERMVVRQIGDFVPPPNTRSSQLLVRRDAEPMPVSVESAGFRYSSPRTLESTALLVGLLAAAFLVFSSPLSRALGFLERRLSDRLTQATRRSDREGGRLPRPAELGWALVGRLPESFAPYLALIASSVVVTLLAFGKALVAPELDLLVLLAGSAVGLAAAALLTGGAEGRWSLLRGIKSALTIAAFQVPAACALVTSVALSGSSRAADIVAMQGVWPWQWTFFFNPAACVVGTMAFLCLVPSVRAIPPLASPRPTTRRQRFLDLAEWAHRLLVGSVLVVVLFGGYKTFELLPSNKTMALGAGLVILKTWAMVATASLLRWVLGVPDLSLFKRLLPWVLFLCGASVAGVLAFRRALPGPGWSSLEPQTGPILFATGLLAAGWLLLRLLRGPRRSQVELSAQPWL